MYGKVLECLGEKNIPSFQEERLRGKSSQPFLLGHACGGEKVDYCMQFYRKFYDSFTLQDLEKVGCKKICGGK